MWSAIWVRVAASGVVGAVMRVFEGGEVAVDFAVGFGDFGSHRGEFGLLRACVVRPHTKIKPDHTEKVDLLTNSLVTPEKGALRGLRSLLNSENRARGDGSAGLRLIWAVKQLAGSSPPDATCIARRRGRCQPVAP